MGHVPVIYPHSSTHFQVWAGNPARYLRDVEPEEHGFVESSALNYAELADLHKCECRAIISGPQVYRLASVKCGHLRFRGWHHVDLLK